MNEDESAMGLGNVPNHVAIIMDGNGRWAQAKGLKRTEGHQEGMEAIRRITKSASRNGVKVLTLYAFSTENWKRPPLEVKFLMDLPIKFFDRFVPELIENNVKVTTIGLSSRVPSPTQQAIDKVVEQTKDNTGMILNFAFNYGSRNEMTEAIKLIAKDVKDNKLNEQDINEELVEQYLYTKTLAPYSDVDLLIRTSGEQRLSNFLLWQNAYSEFYFSKLNWPDFDDYTFCKILVEYQQRNRRYGGLLK